jgi:PAS domain S-box-containing protein
MSLKPTNILLIEDNPGDAQLVKIYMKDAAFRYELTVADTFFEGMDILRKQDMDVVLLDLSLPDTQGFKTLNKYFDNELEVPVVVLTGVNNEIVGNQAVKAGAQDFLVKGQFDGKLLGRVIRYSIQRYRDKQKLEITTRELTINERRIVKAQQLAGFGNWEMDIVSNEMTWTDEVYRIFGFQPNGMTTGLSDYLNYCHHEDRDALEKFFENATKDGKLHKLEHRIVVEGKNIRYLAVHAQVFFDDLTQRLLLVGGVQDITERKQSEQLLMEQNIQRQSSMLKEEVLADMGFHIRTPLSSMIGFIHLMQSATISPQQKELVEGLKTSVDDLSLMINNLLNFSMLVSQQLKIETEEFALHDFFQSLQKVLQIKTDQAQLHFSLQLADNVPERVVTDSPKLTQIIYNLIDHACQHTPADGTIALQVALRQEEKNPTLVVKMAHSGCAVSLARLRSMSEESKILQAIQHENTVQDRQQRQQIGLAIVSKLSKLLQGTLEMRYRDTASTLLEVSLPVTPIYPIVLNDAAPTAPMKVLLVEDHFLNQMATKKILTAWSPLVTVDIAENGFIGVEKYRAHGYDVILMDLQMPVMNGFDATARIREYDSQVPIIALTASASQQEAQRCFDIGMNDYLAKPFKPQELYQKLLTLKMGAA